MDLEEFDYALPESLIAAYPSRERESSRLLVVDRKSGALTHSGFAELGNFLEAGDLLVLNDTKVFPARLRGAKESGGKVEALLIERFPKNGRSLWIAMVDAAKKPAVGSRLGFGADLAADVIGDLGRGRFALEFHHRGDFNALLEVLGEPPLPPGVRRKRATEGSDRGRYQTVYAAHPGIAAPTAGFHFTPELLGRLRAKGIDHVLLTLHVGRALQPVREQQMKIISWKANAL
jgi:S-adenosylmethionine:tRNA ribosyltransferase-isomerase